MIDSDKVNIAIFCSGSGSNAEKIMAYFKDHPHIQVKLLLANNKEAYALQRAANYGIESYTFNRNAFYATEEVIQKLLQENIQVIVLAGFLWLIPQNLIDNFPDRIINIHPALLPKYGGKGMYGSHVHKAVKEAGEHESGITIHLVNEEYDSGKVLYQTSCQLEVSDSTEEIAAKVLQLEHLHFAPTIEKYIKTLFPDNN